MLIHYGVRRNNTLSPCSGYGVILVRVSASELMGAVGRGPDLETAQGGNSGRGGGGAVISGLYRALIGVSAWQAVPGRFLVPGDGLT